MRESLQFSRKINLYYRQATLLALFLLLASIYYPWEAHSAPSYSSLNQEFNKLSADPKKSDMRDPWEKMRAKFDNLAKSNPKSPDAPKAAFMAARCLEEIATRTHSSEDFRNAAQTFGEVGKKYPRAPQGDEALYKKAEIEFKKLKNPDTAQKTLEQLLKNTADSAMKGRAGKLKKEIEKDQGKSSARNESTPSGAAPKQQEFFSEPTLVSIIINADDKKADAEIELSTGAGYSWRFIPKAKNSSGEAALIIEVEGVVPNKGISGVSTVSKGPVRLVRIVNAKVKTAFGKDAPSCRIEFTLKDNYASEIKNDATSNKILLKVDSKKMQTATVSGRGTAGSVDTGYIPQETSAPRNTAASSHSRAEMLGLTVNTILLDPGHGGKDPGAQANGVTESKLVLRIAKLVETKLRKKGFKVSYTRDNDVFIALDKRTETANRRKVDLFVSIHVNANADTSVAGIETYYLNKAKTKSAERVAARENGVSVAAIDDLQVILTDLGLSSKMQESRNLAKDVQSNMEKQIRASGYAVRSNGVRSGPFYVLMGAKMPAILVEVGYCSNKSDANYLKDSKYVERIAEGIANGIIGYKGRIENSLE